jgi:hypothetical protein
MATRRPDSVRGSLAEALSVADGGDELGRVVVAGAEHAGARAWSRPPAMPSTGRPTLRWKSPSAIDVWSPKMPSTRPVSKPRALRRCCSSATSSPRSMGRADKGTGRPAGTGLDQRRPGLRTADPVHPQASPVLERLDRRPGPGAEGPLRSIPGGQPCDPQRHRPSRRCRSIGRPVCSQLKVQIGLQSYPGRHSATLPR